jgi:hypothetical protein
MIRPCTLLDPAKLDSALFDSVSNRPVDNRTKTSETPQVYNVTITQGACLDPGFKYGLDTINPGYVAYLKTNPRLFLASTIT